jgi:hypothetical protein
LLLQVSKISLEEIERNAMIVPKAGLFCLLLSAQFLSESCRRRERIVEDAENFGIKNTQVRCSASWGTGGEA